MSVKKTYRTEPIKLVFKERYYSRDIQYYPFFHKYVDTESGKTLGCIYFSAVSRKNRFSILSNTNDNWIHEEGILIWGMPI